jgi:hypothetical protein
LLAGFLPLSAGWRGGRGGEVNHATGEISAISMLFTDLSALKGGEGEG